MRLDHLSSSAGVFEHEDPRTLREVDTRMEEENDKVYQTDRNLKGKPYELICLY